MKMTMEEFEAELIKGERFFIYLGHQIYTKIDEWNFDWLNQYNWYLGTKRCACTRIEGEYTYMHRLIAESMGLNMQYEIDHEDRDPLNNKEENLRIANDSQQAMNRGLQRNNTSGYPGISWSKFHNKWKVRVKINRKVIYQKYFKNKIDAILDRERKAKEIFGAYYNDEFSINNDDDQE